MLFILRFFVPVFLFVAGFYGAHFAQANESAVGAGVVPLSRVDLENIPKRDVIIGDEDGVSFDIRLDAMKEGALSYGARGGLVWRTFYIRRELDGRAGSLDRVYNFRSLLIPAPSGFLIEPPVVSESINALIVEGGGQTAAVADRVYRINKTAEIVTASRSWRNYLERDWGEVVSPPDMLLPNDSEERTKWINWIRDGWDQGVSQADDIFQDDLNELSADYQGMVRYRVLLAQGMISPPYALQIDRGITGGGANMRVGDRAVQITGTPELITGSEQWQPASR